MKYLAIFLSLGLLAGCGLVQPKTGNSSETAGAPADTKQAVAATTFPSSSSNFSIQPGDVLEILVWKEKDLQKEVMVRADGKLTFPLAGDIDAAGLTFDEFQAALTKKLSRYVPNPVITVSVKQPLGNKIFVVGKVNKPGEIINARSLDVMQALSIAGGLNPYASERSIKIIRRVNGKSRAFTFNYAKVKKGKNLEQNIILQSGDVIVVR